MTAAMLVLDPSFHEIDTTGRDEIAEDAGLFGVGSTQQNRASSPDSDVDQCING